MKIALLQMRSVLDYKINLQTILSYKKRIQEARAEALFLPECFYSLTDGTQITPYLVTKDNEHMENLRLLARELATPIIGGSVAALTDEGRVVNRVFNLDSQGHILSIYDKRHLFSLNLSDTESGKKHSHQESKFYTAGIRNSSFEFNDFKIGISICFDLRFPEMYRSYFQEGVNLISISSAFTIPTGKAHWHTLVRARAIENQSYVVATAQTGKHNERVSTYGHSLVVGPWGEILLDAGEGEALHLVEIDRNQVDDVRARMSVTPQLIP